MSTDSRQVRVERELFVRAFLSANPPARVAAQLTRAMREKQAEPGTVVYRKGEPASELHFVVTGSLRLERPGAEPWDFGAGTLVGMFDASIPRPHERTAVAKDSCRLLTLDFGDYLDVLEDNFGFAVETLMLGARDQLLLSGQLDTPQIFSRASLGRAESRAPEATDSEVIDRLLVLREVGIFRRAPVQALWSLARLAELTSWRDGERVFSAGDAVRQLSVVAAGEVAVTQGEHEVARFWPGGLVGGLEALGREQHEFAATACRDSVTLSVSLEDVLDVAEDHFDLCRSLLSFVASERARVVELLSHRQSTSGRRTI